MKLTSAMDDMKAAGLIAWLLFMTGCGDLGPRPTAPLSAEQASSLAQQWANEKAEALYQCRPFRSARAARFEAGRWQWQDRRASGQGDLEARVSFAADGSKRAVEVLLMINHPAM